MRTSLLAVAALALAPACTKNQEKAPAASGSGSAGSAAMAPVLPADAAIRTADAALAPQAPAPINTDTLLQAEAIGPLAVGMTDAAATKELGAPAKKTPAREEGATGDFVSSWTWPGVELEMAGEKRQGPFTVRLITVVAPSAYATKRGIKIGSTLAEVARLYPKSDEGSDDPTLFLVGSLYGGLLFETKGDTVVKIVLGPMAF